MHVPQIQPERLVSDAERALAAKPDASGTVDEYRIEVFDAAGLPDELKEWTFQLVKTNMEAT